MRIHHFIPFFLSVLKNKVVPDGKLLQLHQLLGSLYNRPWLHPEYHPHITLAFLKRGMGKKYLDKGKFGPAKILVDQVTFATFRDRSKPRVPVHLVKK